MRNSGLHDDLARHRRWLDRELGFDVDPDLTELLPTYVIRVSDPRWGGIAKIHIAGLVAQAIGRHGASITDAIGIWNGEQEREVTITIQCQPDIVNRLLDELATVEGIRYVHIEKHEVPTVYIDLNARRNQ